MIDAGGERLFISCRSLGFRKEQRIRYAAASSFHLWISLCFSSQAGSIGDRSGYVKGDSLGEMVWIPFSIGMGGFGK